MRVLTLRNLFILLLSLGISGYATAQDDDLDSLMADLAADEEIAETAGEAEAVIDDFVGELEAEIGDEMADLDDEMADLDDEMADLDDEMAELEEAAGDTMDAAEDMAEEFSEELPEEMTGETDVAEAAPAGAEVDADLVKQADALNHHVKVRRQAKEKEALGVLDEANKALSEGKWLKAVDLFSAAVDGMQNRAATEFYIDNAKAGIAEAKLQLATNIYNARREGGKLEDAETMIAEAKEIHPGHRGLNELTENIDRFKERVARGVEDIHIRKSKEVVDRNETVSQLLKEGKELYEVREFDLAAEKFEGALYFDKYNKDAMRFLKKISEKKYDFINLQRKLTKSDMINDVRTRWNRPIGETAVLPSEFSDKGTTISQPEDELRKKLEGIIIPEITFKQAKIADVIDFLINASREADPDGFGANIIYMDPESAGGGEEAADDDFGAGADGFGDMFGEEDDGFGGLDDVAPAVGSGGGANAITLSLRRVSLLDALKFVTEIAQLHYRFDGNVVIINKLGSGGNVVTRFYPVDGARFNTALEANNANAGGGGGFDDGGFEDFDGGGSSAGAGGGDVQAIFERYGIQFPKGTSVSFEPLISQLIVTQTPENIEKFERILNIINVTPTQVEIEARFVEVRQTDLDAIGFEWILTDNYEIASKTGVAPVSSRERIQVDANNNGVTQGLRFFGSDAQDPSTTRAQNAEVPFVSDLLSISGVLTNPELQVVVHALDQSGNADLLSAPRVTTINGVNAVIEVVREIIYPTEFDIEESNDNDTIISANIIDPTVSLFRPPTVIPGAFETREIGVILNVTPTVNPDNYTINLTILPEIAELVEWIQYGAILDDFQVNIPQPVFSSRNVTTSMIVWDGHTVVMGGLIREDLISFEDKVPLLGDLPLLGRLFRSEGTRSEKRNLLIFVTARLVNPAGEPINRRQKEIGGAASETASTAN